VFLKSREGLNGRQRGKFIEVSKVPLELAVMHCLREEFGEIFESSENWAEGTLRSLDWVVEPST
jgi:transposase